MTFCIINSALVTLVCMMLVAKDTYKSKIMSDTQHANTKAHMFVNVNIGMLERETSKGQKSVDVETGTL